MNRAQDNKNFFGGIASKGHKCISDPIEPKSALEPSYSVHAQLSYIHIYLFIYKCVYIVENPRNFIQQSSMLVILVQNYIIVNT